jgi:hypothetical protein
MGWWRAAVGLALIAAPGPVLRLSRREPPTGASILLLRTIGIRDLVLGLGTVAADRSEEPGECRRWMVATLASDALDVVVSVRGMAAIGPVNSVAAATVALVAVGGDLHALVATDRRPALPSA